MVQAVIATGCRSGALQGLRQGVGEDPAEPPRRVRKHAEFGPRHGAEAQAQRYGYTQMINNATLTNSSAASCASPRTSTALSRRDRHGHRRLRRRGRQALLDGRPDSGGHPRGRRGDHGLGGLSREQYFAINIVFEPPVGEPFRSGFLMQVASSNGDFITPAVISAAEADGERNLANAVDSAPPPARDRRRAPPSTQPRPVQRLGPQARRRLRSPARRWPPSACSPCGRSRTRSRCSSPMPGRTRSSASTASSASLGPPDPAKE